MKITSLPPEVETIVQRLLSGLTGRKVDEVRSHIANHAWDDLSNMKVNPDDYSSAESYWNDVQAVSFLRKCVDLPTTVDRKQKAVENFWVAERECYRSNERLSPYLHTPGGEDCVELVTEVISAARKKVSSVLGPLSLRSLEREARFGPGSTYGDKGSLTTIPDKMSSHPTFTSSSLSFLPSWAGTLWAQASSKLGRSILLSKGNRFTTVPKDCTKDRGIAIEPSVPLFYQLGVGSVLKQRLRNAGLDLLHAQDKHRRVACEASKTGLFATIDLSNASDTICTNLVKLLLPEDWHEPLFALRSPMTQVDGKWVALEKFSSMGNGFTFELETLIFAALSSAAIEVSSGVAPIWGSCLHVFGDDIIVPTRHAGSVLSVLKFFGFTPNESKTFVKGNFRESCGGDFFNGVNVRPFFLKEFPYAPQHFIAMANGIRSLGSPDDVFCPRTHRLRPAWFCILDALPSGIRRCRGPSALGDVVIADDLSRWDYRWTDGIRYVRAYVPVKVQSVGWNHFHPDVVLASSVLRVGDGFEGVTPRDPITSMGFGWVAHS